MKRHFLIFMMMLWAIGSYADKLPKSVEKARQFVASVVTYRNGVMLHNGVAVFAGEKGEFLSARSLFVGADSAVVIDNKGVARPVKHIVGVNEVFDCVKARVAADKKLKAMPVSVAPVVAGETLYQDYGPCGWRIRGRSFPVLFDDSQYYRRKETFGRRSGKSTIRRRTYS